MDYQTFRTKKAALKAAERMIEWRTKVTQLYIPDDPNADKAGRVWVVRCNEVCYLRNDGYVR